MEINLLIRLLIAHLLTDFLFQPKSWVIDKNLKKVKSKKLLLHVGLTVIVAYLFSGHYSNFYIPATILVTHYLIDLWKVYQKDSFLYFIADQAMHVLIIVLLGVSIENSWSAVETVTANITAEKNVWLILAAYLFVTWPLGIIIGKGTERWRNQINKEMERAQIERMYRTRMDGKIAEVEQQAMMVPEEQGLGLASAGKWIGICERILIFSFILLHQYTAIGFLMTAKSILRFSEKESNTQLKTEYILVGTLVSFTSSVLLGLIVSWLL